MAPAHWVRNRPGALLLHRCMAEALKWTTVLGRILQFCREEAKAPCKHKDPTNDDFW